MPTATRPATAAQVRFITSLYREREQLIGQRGALADTTLRRAYATIDDPAYTGVREATALIDALLAIRVGDRPAARRAAQDSGAADMPAPTADTRAGRMLTAGSVEATVTLLDGRHVTVTIRTRTRSGRGWTNADLGTDGARTKITILGSQVGWINRHGDQYRLTLRTRRPEYVAAVNAVLAYCAGVTLLDGVLRVQESSRCGRCFRTLTDPVSIDRGIGPECFGRSTGSQHVNSGRTMDALETVADALSTPAPVALPVDYPEVEPRDDAAETVNIVRTRLPSTPPSPTLSSLAAIAASPVLSRDAQRARDLISEALDSYCSDADRDFAMRVFDDLAAA